MRGPEWLCRIPRASIQLHPSQIKAAVGCVLRRADDDVDKETVARFEESFGRYQDSSFSIAVSSGKVALALILDGLGARRGDGIVMASYNVPEVISVVAGLGLRPRLADIDPDTLNIDPDEVLRVADKRTRFLLITHLYGHPADIDRLVAAADSKGLTVIEDCAQGLGATWRGRRVGTFGRASMFSFGMMKNLNTIQGGMVCTDDEALATRVRRMVVKAGFMRRAPLLKGLASSIGLRVATSRAPFSLGLFPIIRVAEGLTPALLHQATKMRPAAFETGNLDIRPMISGMNGIQAAMGLAGLPRVDVANAMRAHNAVRLASRLDGLPGVRCQMPLDAAGQSWLNFVIRVRNRLALKRSLLREGIDTTMGFLMACNRMPSMIEDAGRCPVSEELEDTNLYLPIWPELDDRDIDHVADSVIKAMDRK
ncbi:MAG: hypothetical protein GXP54_07390 [Deltaproteobacteria bacterium]|nr:hypothetical protein [Deltaproteobacteria bacterium]